MRLVERLIAFRTLVPAYIESGLRFSGTFAGGLRYRIHFLRRSEFHLQTLLSILPVFQPPAADAPRRRSPQISARILQMLVAEQNLGPLPVVFFQNGRAPYENR